MDTIVKSQDPAMMNTFGDSFFECVYNAEKQGGTLLPTQQQIASRWLKKDSLLPCLVFAAGAGAACAVRTVSSIFGAAEGDSLLKRLQERGWIMPEIRSFLQSPLSKVVGNAFVSAFRVPSKKTLAACAAAFLFVFSSPSFASQEAPIQETESQSQMEESAYEAARSTVEKLLEIQFEETVKNASEYRFRPDLLESIRMAGSSLSAFYNDERISNAVLLLLAAEESRDGRMITDWQKPRSEYKKMLAESGNPIMKMDDLIDTAHKHPYTIGFLLSEMIEAQRVDRESIEDALSELSATPER